MTAQRCAGVVLLGLFGLLCIAGNLLLTLRWLLRRKSGSLVPFVGGLSGAGAVLPMPAAPPLLWLLPLVLDLGCLPLTVTTVIAFVRRRVEEKH